MMDYGMRRRRVKEPKGPHQEGGNDSRKFVTKNCWKERNSYVCSQCCLTVALEDIRERKMQRTRESNGLESSMKDRSMNTEVKRDLRNSTILPTLTYGTEFWKWNEIEQSAVTTVEMNKLRHVSVVTRLDRMRNDEMSFI